MREDQRDAQFIGMRADLFYGRFVDQHVARQGDHGITQIDLRHVIEELGRRPFHLADAARDDAQLHRRPLRRSDGLRHGSSGASQECPAVERHSGLPPRLPGFG